MGLWNIARPGKRWPDYIADVERTILSKSPEEQQRIFEIFAGLGGLLTGLPDDVAGALYDAILVTVPKFGPGHDGDQLWQRAEAAAPKLLAAIRSFGASP